MDQRLSGPTQHVDESGRHRKAAGVDIDGRLRTAQISNGFDSIAANTDIGPGSGSAGAVIHSAATNDDVVNRRCRARRRHGHEDERAADRYCLIHGRLLSENFIEAPERLDFTLLLLLGPTECHLHPVRDASGCLIAGMTGSAKPGPSHNDVDEGVRHLLANRVT